MTPFRQRCILSAKTEIAMQIKYLDLQAQYRSIKSEIDAAVKKVLDSSAYVLGPAVAEFETAFAAYCGVSHCVGVNSGTSALLLALKAMGVGDGDEVITAANTFIATAAAIAHAGARPVLVDVDPQTKNIDPDLIGAAVSPRTRAIVPVHLCGRPADMDPIIKISHEHGLPVLEDAAQAHGADYKGKQIGSIGTMAAFSFYPGKNLGAYGEAGAVVTDNRGLAEIVRMLRDHGSSKKYIHEILGYNARMDGIQGAVLGVKLKYLDEWNAARNRIARKYNELLNGLPLRLPTFDGNICQTFHLYVIETDRRDSLMKYLSEQNIPTLIHYPIPIHLQEAFTRLGHSEGDFPVTEKLSKEMLSLPIYPEMSDDHVHYVAERIRAFFE